jgi:hypothetical protein
LKTRNKKLPLEIEILERLSKTNYHPNIIKYDDFIIESERNDIVMIFEYCEVKTYSCK